MPNCEDELTKLREDRLDMMHATLKALGEDFTRSEAPMVSWLSAIEQVKQLREDKKQFHQAWCDAEAELATLRKHFLEVASGRDHLRRIVGEKNAELARLREDRQQLAEALADANAQNKELVARGVQQQDFRRHDEAELTRLRENYAEARVAYNQKDDELAALLEAVNAAMPQIVMHVDSVEVDRLRNLTEEKP